MKSTSTTRMRQWRKNKRALGWQYWSELLPVPVLAELLSHKRKLMTEYKAQAKK